MIPSCNAIAASLPSLTGRSCLSQSSIPLSLASGLTRQRLTSRRGSLKLEEGLTFCTRLRRFLVEHPLLVLELGFRPILNVEQPYGFDVERTVPTARWLREQQRTLSPGVLQTLLLRTVEELREEIPGLGEVVSFDVTQSTPGCARTIHASMFKAPLT